MTFQFRCPGGCLLQGDPAQAGSTIACPICGQMFIVPAPVAAPQSPAQQPAQQPLAGHPQAPGSPQHAQQPHPQQPHPQQAHPQQPHPQQAYPQQAHPQQPHPQQAYLQQPQQPAAGAPTPAQPAQPQGAGPSQPAATEGGDSAPIKTSPAARILGDSYRVLNFPCPCGQWVEAPRELAGQNATCPHCGQPFQLLETESREYLEAVEIQRRRREARIGNAWLNWSIAVAVFVLVGLAALIIKSQLDN